MDIPAFVSQRFDITVETAEERRKVFQILFRKTDGSLFVSFPYYSNTTGLLTLVTLRARTKYPASVSMRDGGKVTGHRVKYSHHPDGAVLFSQDGRIMSKVRKMSVPLSEAEGHIFTVQLQGLRDFQSLEQNEAKPLSTDKKRILHYHFDDSKPEAIKFVGLWYSESSLTSRIFQRGDKHKPHFIIERPDHSRVRGMFISDPFLRSDGHYYLLLACEGIPILDKDRYSTLMFLGGFDRRQISLNHEMDTRFLMLNYPAADSYEDLARQIGSVDLTEPSLI